MTTPAEIVADYRKPQVMTYDDLLYHAERMAECLEQLRKRIDELETALGWYLCEDHKEVEMGVLEGVWKRPAHKALIGRFEVKP